LQRTVRLWVDAFAKHDLLTCASAIAFQVLKSLIPLALLGIALLGVLSRRDIWARDVAPTLRPRLDPTAYRAINDGVDKIFAHDSVPLLVFACALTVWYVSGGVRAIIGGINRIYETDDNRPLWTRWPLSFGLALCVVGGVVGAALLVLAVPRPHGADGIFAGIGLWLAAIGALGLATGLLVRLGPIERRPKRWASTGAVLIVGTWIVTSVLFRWYVSSVASFKSAVGQLTVFLVLMVYVYASSIVFLVGVQLDELLREDATAGDRGILAVLFGIGRERS
jgi:membrane protein